MTTSFLTPWLIERIQYGEAILFLGAGASYGAIGKKGEKPLSGFQLRDNLADKFLGGKHKDKPLARVAEYAKYESTLFEVQAHIKKLFFPLDPAEFHKLITSFRWHAIVTTNYDLIIERAYEKCEKALQHLQPIIRDGDNFSDVIKDNTALPYLKLHGCLTATNDEQLPLILASEEYAKHRKNRDRLFKHFADWARERPVIFVGYDISDPNVQQILFDLTDLGVHRPPYVIVDPGLDDISMRYWQAHRFVTIATTFEKFLTDLDSAINPVKRGISALVVNKQVSFQSWIATHLHPSDRLITYLQEELSHIYPGMITSGVDPKGFYNGTTSSWCVFEQNLDIRRKIADEILLDTVLSAKEAQASKLFLVKGHAGAGTSVLLKRIAWDAANDFEGLVFTLNKGGVVRVDLILEIGQLVKCPFLLVIDDGIPHLDDVLKLIDLSKKEGISISVLLGARTNEWNISGAEFENQITQDYELRDLTEREIQDLVVKLEQHKSLGELIHLPPAGRIEKFKNGINRQLLVALHEATTGKPFEEIVLSEFQNIVPLSAQLLYLDICSLHRLGVPVRAGLISRVSEITFNYFNDQLFKPLEHVLNTYFDHACKDYVYTTRHPLIAEFVFIQALPNPVERAAQIKRIIRHMDVDYESDREAFSQLIRGKVLAKLFMDKAIASDIFLAAEESGAQLSFIFHQKAVFELNHPNGNMSLALQYLNKAEENVDAGRDRSIEHTKAVILRRMALETNHSLEKEKYRAEARQILAKQIKSAKVSYPFNTLGQLLLDILKDQLELLKTDTQSWKELDQRGIAELVRQAEECIFSGLQLFPGDEFLLTLDATLATLLDDEPRALASLKQAFTSQPGRAFIAVRLARSLKKQGNGDEAIITLEKCLAENPSSKECHLELGLLYSEMGEEIKKNEVSYHFKRSFTDGDTNLQAQLLFARHEFLYGDREHALALFKKLSEARISPVLKTRIQKIAKSADGSPVLYNGYIKTKGESYCFVSCTELRSDIFIHAQQFKEAQWESAKEGGRLRMQIGFTFKGPQGVEPILIGY